MYGKGLVSDDTMNAHKRRAMGKLDPGSMAGSTSGGKMNQKPASSGELPDGGRGIGGAGKVHGQQPAPDHGQMGGDHHRRGGLL